MTARAVIFNKILLEPRSGVEPETSCLPCMRSNLLSYRGVFNWLTNQTHNFLLFKHSAKLLFTLYMLILPLFIEFTEGIS